jgi:hypothetical protein
MIEEEHRFGTAVRLPESYRNNIDASLGFHSDGNLHLPGVGSAMTFGNRHDRRIDHGDLADTLSPANALSFV